MSNKSKVIKLQCPFERIKKHNACPEVNLYRAVIMQMIIDATNVSKNPKMIKNADHAKEFLFGNGEDLEIICDNAGLTKSEVIKLAHNLIKSQKRKVANKI